MAPSGSVSEDPKSAVVGRPGARLLLRSARLVAMAFLLPAVVRPCLSLRPWSDALVCAAVYAVVGLGALLAATFAWNQVLMRGRLAVQVGQGNLAAGIAGASHLLGAGIVAAHCLAGDGLAALPVSLAFFVIAQGALIALVLLFRCLTYYADDQEIAGENHAAGISYAGVVLALSIIVGHAADGPFLGWGPALRGFGLSLLLCLVVYPVRQIVVARLFLGLPLTWRGGALDRAIAQDRDVVVSIIEALGALAAAWLATGLA
jgi:uncharacterized membrane protein YjfL (UPF0719 family)